MKRRLFIKALFAAFAAPASAVAQLVRPGRLLGRGSPADISASGYILDDVAGAVFAYSLNRYLASDFEGNAVVKLEEDNGGTTQDFKLSGGTLVTDDVNEDTVAEWLTGASASAARENTIYDQSGNGNNAVQTTDGNQPDFAASGIGSKPSGDWNGSADWMDIAADPLTLPSITIVAAAQAQSTAGDADQSFIFGTNSAEGARIYMGLDDAPAWYFRLGAAADTTGGTADTDAHVFTLRDNAGSGILRVDQSQVASTSHVASATPSNQTIGAFGAGTTARWNGLIPEIIAWNSALSNDDMASVETDIGEFYGIL